jgi:ABC-type sulfate transport system substrate-binding protein
MYRTTRRVNFMSISIQPLKRTYVRRTGRHVRVLASHGGSARQSRAIIAGEEPADVVTPAMFSDVDALRKHGLTAPGCSRILGDSVAELRARPLYYLL